MEEWRLRPMENRRARNEAFFREVNERIEAISRDFADGDQGPERLRLVCECGRDECTELLEATVSEYEAVRAHARRFLVLPDHEHAETARIVEQNSRFFVVEKLEEEGEVAIEHDPRS
jgi:sulfur transfer protein SufE